MSGIPPTRLDPIKVLVVDDHAFFRRGLVSVLAEEPDIDVVGEAGDGEEAVSRASALRPDVVLMDVRMPKAGGIAACTGIRDAVPDAKIVMLTMSDEEEDLFEAIKAGATGYLLKEISVVELPAAVRAVSGGQSFINPSMATKLIGEFATLARKEKGRPQPVAVPRLTGRETEVLRLVARGLNNRDIADRLYISDNTVKNHVRNILEKLQLHSRTEAAVYAIREKFLDTDGD
ncbi:response regulator [Actinorugispora endophytica]|uniref:LuxR family two component transcriptional regulator n=1 Tax=Actinorugispora endophytica TaxID=1605990 RepID=A0A4R6V1R0_9ACTN|nr:response regulator transcription factor [Actinorugispora endophytica]TDQ51965.1 LuxR family two component transcriptional regulator [Actinorugispora endophytica]